MSDTPDFDSMSPEEMMEWMESLAIRQGAAEGFTTNASMEIEEVDENDERLAGQGEYKPYGMSDEEWEKMKAREEEEKAARIAAQQQAPAIPMDDVEEDIAYEDDDDFIEYEDDDDYFEYEDSDEYEYVDDSEELVQADLSMLGFDSPPEPAEEQPAAQSPTDWLANLAGDDGDTSPEPAFEEPAAQDPTDWLAGLSEAEAQPVAEQPAAQDPTDWLAGLGATDEQPDLELDMDALASLERLGNDNTGDDPMSWLASLSGEGDVDTNNDLSALGDIVDSDVELEGGMEDSMEWMESLAKRQGANTEELVTDANLDVPEPSAVSDGGPGYEDFSFEEATGMIQDAGDTDTMQISGDPNPDELELEDPSSWLDQLASDVNDSAELPDDLFAGNNIIDGDDDFEDEFVAEAADADGDEFESLAENVKSQIDSGRLGDSPEDVDKFFQSAFAKASTRDVPDYFDDEDDDEALEDSDEMPVQAEIPDWLEQSMASAPVISEDEPEEADDIPVKKATAEMMIADLGLDDVEDGTDIPDWLQGGMEDDSGDINADIFDDAIIGETEPSEPVTPIDVTDTQDTWVEAFSAEESQELAAWYEGARADATGDADNQPAIQAEPTAELPTEGLQAADLPIESELPEGSPQTVPDWLAGEVIGEIRDTHQSVEMVAAPDNVAESMDMDWLTEGEEDAIEADMPDWLRENVDDTVADSDDLPEWLAGETDISPEEIPDWLRETMDEDEEQEAIEIAFEDEPEPAPLPVAPVQQTTLPAPVEQSPAPVPVEADNVDAVAYLRGAKEKIAGGDLDGALRDYELVIRANKALSQVEKELQRLAGDNNYKKNPAVNRVLGDVLMRQGKLQEALDIYRRALNML
ncbi:MAG: tetratricopeptide repeat protein [Chloroflexota bacterium]